MKHHRHFIHILVCVLILFFGASLALALPWFADAQTQAAAAQHKTGLENAPEAATRYYVATTGDGTSPTLGWSTAFTNPQDALAAAVNPSEIWVAEGIYYPDEGIGQINNAVSSTFVLTDGVALFGGFDTGDSQLSERDWFNNLTILSGDIDKDDDTDINGVVTDTSNINGANSWHVVTAIGVSTTSKLDGFTITAGNANGTSPPNFYGGGFYCQSAGASSECVPSLENLAFIGNQADWGGGAMYNFKYSSPTLTNVIFSANSSNNGGAMYNFSDFFSTSNPHLTNVLFSGNYAAGDGGAMNNTGVYDGASNPIITNATFSGNYAGGHGGAIYNDGSTFGFSYPEMRNSVVWNNQDSSGTGTISATIYNNFAAITITHSLVQNLLPGGSWIGGSFIDGGANKDQDPLFIDNVDPAGAPTTDGNLRLTGSSPAVDAGDDAYISGVLTDLDGEDRIKDGDADGIADVDMGAYEAEGYYQLTVTKTGSGGGQVSSTPPGIDCGSTCEFLFLEDTIVTLEAIADSNSTFTGWGGVCSGNENCLVSMSGAISVTANFESNPLLSVYRGGNGDGTVTSSPKGITCGTHCSEIFPYGSKVQLFADPNSFSIFKGWSGACSGSGDCTVDMDSNKTVTAIFDLRPTPNKVYFPISLGEKTSKFYSFSGNVTYQGSPVHVGVNLYYWDGSRWSVYASTSTDGNGYYKFLNVPKLSGDQVYSVGFENIYHNDSWLLFWDCWDVTPAKYDPYNNVCNFDIENIYLYSPDPDASVSLPQDFLWVPRVTTSDNYVFYIGDPDDYDPIARTDFLGYVYGVNITNLPSGFFTHTEYGWWVDVVGPHGWGTSYYYRAVTFLNISSSSALEQNLLTQINTSDWSENRIGLLENFPHKPNFRDVKR